MLFRSWYFYRYMDPHNDEEFCSKEAADYWQQVDFYLGGAEHAVGHLLYSRFWNHFMHDLGLVPHREFAKKLVNQGMIQGRSNFVYRAKERFFEEYLWLKVLQPFFAEMGPMVISEPGFEEEHQYDFAFETNDLVIEVTSWKQEEKIARVRTTAQSDGKRLMVLFTEELTDSINEPESTAAYEAAAAQNKNPPRIGEPPRVYRLFGKAKMRATLCFSEPFVQIQPGLIHQTPCGRQRRGRRCAQFGKSPQVADV